MSAPQTFAAYQVKGGRSAIERDRYAIVDEACYYTTTCLKEMMLLVRYLCVYCVTLNATRCQTSQALARKTPNSIGQNAEQSGLFPMCHASKDHRHCLHRGNGIFVLHCHNTTMKGGVLCQMNSISYVDGRKQCVSCVIILVHSRPNVICPCPLYGSLPLPLFGS